MNPFEQQVSEVLKELLTPLTHEYGGKADYYADVIAPRVAAAIEAAIDATEADENVTGRSPSEAALTALRGGHSTP